MTVSYTFESLSSVKGTFVILTGGDKSRYSRLYQRILGLYPDLIGKKVQTIGDNIKIITCDKKNVIFLDCLFDNEGKINVNIPIFEHAFRKYIIKAKKSGKYLRDEPFVFIVSNLKGFNDAIMGLFTSSDVFQNLDVVLKEERNSTDNKIQDIVYRSREEALNLPDHLKLELFPKLVNICDVVQLAMVMSKVDPTSKSLGNILSACVSHTE